MFFPLFFIVPIVFATLAAGLPLALNRKLPAFINVTIGRLKTRDIRSLNDSHLAYLRKLTRVRAVFATFITAIIGAAFIALGYVYNPTAAPICCAVQFVTGMLSFRPLFKAARIIKEQIDNHFNA